MKFRAVTFDVGGTLIEPWPSVGEVYADVARRHGLACDGETLTRAFGRAWKQRSSFNYTKPEWHELVRHSFAEFGPVGPELFDAIYDRFAEPDVWRVFDDVIPALEFAKGMGLKLGLISNWDERLRPLLGRLRLLEHFDAVIVSSETGAHKPDPRIFQAAVESLNLAPETIIHIGDSDREDVEGARAAGMFGLKISRKERSGTLSELLEKAMREPLLNENN